MTTEVTTPITQALREGTLTRRELKQLMARTNAPALIRLLIWFMAMMLTGVLVWLSIGTGWLLPAMFIHGVLLVHHFSLQHECCHYTAFRTRWLNDLMGNYCGLVIMLPNRFFRYEHCDHHTFTQLADRDPEMIPMPETLRDYLLYLSSWPYWKTKFSELLRHCQGRLNNVERRFIPKVEHRTVFTEARIMVLFYATVALVCIVFNWSAPLWYWLVPVMLAEPLMRAIRMTEHVGRPATGDLTENTRTNIVSWPMQFLCWNMNFHAEHHYASSVPFHALPVLHRKLAGFIYSEKRGYIGAHTDILSQLLKRKQPD